MNEANNYMYVVPVCPSPEVNQSTCTWCYLVRDTFPILLEHVIYLYHSCLHCSQMKCIAHSDTAQCRNAPLQCIPDCVCTHRDSAETPSYSAYPTVYVHIANPVTARQPPMSSAVHATQTHKRLLKLKAFASEHAHDWCMRQPNTLSFTDQQRRDTCTCISIHFNSSIVLNMNCFTNDR